MNRQKMLVFLKNESLGNRNNLSLFYLNKFLIRSSKGNETQIQNQNPTEKKDFSRLTTKCFHNVFVSIRCSTCLIKTAITNSLKTIILTGLGSTNHILQKKVHLRSILTFSDPPVQLCFCQSCHWRLCPGSRHSKHESPAGYSSAYPAVR